MLAINISCVGFQHPWVPRKSPNVWLSWGFWTSVVLPKDSWEISGWWLEWWWLEHFSMVNLWLITIYLVGGDWNILEPWNFMTSHSVGNGTSSQLTLTPSFFRGVGIPPTRFDSSSAVTWQWKVSSWTFHVACDCNSSSPPSEGSWAEHLGISMVNWHTKCDPKRCTSWFLTS